ncbi:MAG: alpha/beta hydrolase [Polyangiaceae bacterium]|nr:alpha/beta hydrolase [Polyangiaceae bacterium]
MRTMVDVEWRSVRRALGAFLVDGFFTNGSRLAKLHPLARPERHGVELVADVAYGASGRSEHLLDVYRPIDGAAHDGLRARHARSGARPVVLYVHGGGFRILSKESHFLMALAFARRGYVVFNINYRLAPKHPYPAAIEDCADAYAWVVENAARFGGDPSRILLAGESAGANLVTSMTVAAAYDRPEPYARRILETGIVPKATIPACGILQVSDVERLARRRRISPFILDRLLEVSTVYLPLGSAAGACELADPLCIIERSGPPARALPPFFIPCGTKDPLLDDTRRLGKALATIGVRADVRIYPGEPHAFHALMWRPHARKCWAETYAFLDEVLD